MARRGLPKAYPVLELLCQLSIRVEEPPQFRAWGAILRLDWTHYQDAACPDPAMRLGVPLAALDDAPRQAANRHDVAALLPRRIKSVRGRSETRMCGGMTATMPC
jgi:hypothetical protein